MSKKKKKRNLKIKNIIIFICLLVLFLFLIYYIFNMPIKNIYIKGNTILSDNDILSISKIDNYPSFLLTSNNEIEKRLKANEYVKDVKVKKKVGNIIVVYLIEYKVLAVDSSDSMIILSNGNKISNNYNIFDVPVITNEINKSIYDNFCKKFNKVNIDILRQISEITYSPVLVDDERFQLYMDDGNLVYITLTKIDKLNKYNSIKAAMGGKKGIIYLDSGDYIELKDKS